MAPAKRLAVFDVPAGETSEAQAEAQPEPVEPDQPVAADVVAQPQPSTAATAAPAAATSTVTIPVDAAPAPKAAPAFVATPPPPKPAGGPPSEMPADWQSRVLGRLNAVKAYLSSPRARHQQGVVLIRFTLDRTGVGLAVALAQSSGFALLDREALASTRGAVTQAARDYKGRADWPGCTSGIPLVMNAVFADARESS